MGNSNIIDGADIRRCALLYEAGGTRFAHYQGTSQELRDLSMRFESSFRPVSTRKVTRVGRFEADLANFVVSWLPYGGPPNWQLEEEFGMNKSRAVSYLLMILHAHRLRTLICDDPEFITRLMPHYAQLNQIHRQEP